MFTMGPPLWGSGDGGGDPYCSYVRTLLHFDDTTTVDAAVPPLTWSNLSTVALTTDFYQFGGASLDCRSSTAAGLIGPGSAALALGTQDFCIEAWFNDQFEPGANQWWFNHIGSVDSIGIWSLSAGTFVPNGGGSSGLTSQSYLGGWIHIAVVRNGNTMYCYLNGAESHSWDCTGWNHGTGIATFYLGRSSGVGSGKLLLIDEFRVTVGVPRYTGPFFPEGPFPAGCAVTGLSLPYTLTFDQADKDTMLATYEVDGITISPLGDGAGGGAEYYEGGVMLLLSNYDNLGYPTPIGPVSGSPTAYIRANSFGTILPQQLTIDLPSGTLARRVNFDYWANGTIGVGDAILYVYYSDTTVETRDLASTSSGGDVLFERLVSNFPTTPPGGAVYITSIMIEQVNACIIAVDNLTFYP